MLCSDGSQSDCRPTIQRMVTTQVPYRNTPNGSGGSGVGGGGVNPLKGCFAYHFENSYGPAFSRTLTPLEEFP